MRNKGQMTEKKSLTSYRRHIGKKDLSTNDGYKISTLVLEESLKGMLLSVLWKESFSEAVSDGKKWCKVTCFRLLHCRKLLVIW